MRERERECCDVSKHITLSRPKPNVWWVSGIWGAWVLKRGSGSVRECLGSWNMLLTTLSSRCWPKSMCKPLFLSLPHLPDPCQHQHQLQRISSTWSLLNARHSCLMGKWITLAHINVKEYDVVVFWWVTRAGYPFINPLLKPLSFSLCSNVSCCRKMIACIWFPHKSHDPINLLVQLACINIFPFFIYF